MNEEDLVEFRVTFGVQYKHDPHPAGWPHADGWLTVVAPNETVARDEVYAMVGQRWSFIYAPWDARYPGKDKYPMGELRRVYVRVVPDGDE